MPISGLGSCEAGSSSQAGSAVVGALLIVVVVTAIAASLMIRQSAFLRTVQTEQTLLQARLLSRTGLEWSISLLRQEGARRRSVHWDDAWAVPLQRTRFGDEARGQFGEFSGQIEDAQAKFNLRNIVREGTLDAQEVDVFLRLCALVEVKAPACQQIVRYVLLAQPSAGEDNDEAKEKQQGAMADSSGQPEPRRRPPIKLVAPRAPMPRIVDDLLTIPGVDAEVVAKLAPVVTILPGPTWINANTTRAEVLAAGVPGLSLEQAQALLDERDRGQWFINRGDFSNRLRRPDLPVSSIRIGISSEWFIVSGMVSNESTVMVTRTLLHRDSESNDVRVAWAQEGL